MVVEKGRAPGAEGGDCDVRQQVLSRADALMVGHASAHPLAVRPRPPADAVPDVTPPQEANGVQQGLPGQPAPSSASRWHSDAA